MVPTGAELVTGTRGAPKGLVLAGCDYCECNANPISNARVIGNKKPTTATTLKLADVLDA
jgi:hypothetical protein